MRKGKEFVNAWVNILKKTPTPQNLHVSWLWRPQIPLKYWHIFTRLHVVTSRSLLWDPKIALRFKSVMPWLFSILVCSEMTNPPLVVPYWCDYRTSVIFFSVPLWAYHWNLSCGSCAKDIMFFVWGRTAVFTQKYTEAVIQY